jgi:AcrR family transcriptional regulator
MMGTQSIEMSTRKAFSREPAAGDAPGVRWRRPGKPARPAGACAESSESTRERILTSAARLFAERGFEGASMPAIAKASGITAGAIYKHFKGKGELLLEVVVRSFLSSPLFAQAPENDDVVAALPRLAAAYTDPEQKLVRQLSIEVHSAATRDIKVRQVLFQSNRLTIARISSSIEQAQKEGRIDPRLNPEHAARAFCVMIMGLVHMETLMPDLVGDAKWREFVRDRVATLIGAR